MSKVLIIYHSQTGNTEAMSKAVYDGASAAGATVTLKKAADATSEDLLNCDAVAFGSPVYFGEIAGAIKDFFDRVYYASRGKVDNKPYVAFSTAGGGGKQALHGIDRLCSNLKLREISEGIAIAGAPSPKILEQCRELGRELAQA